MTFKAIPERSGRLHLVRFYRFALGVTALQHLFRTCPSRVAAPNQLVLGFSIEVSQHCGESIRPPT